ncbi:MAG: nucleoside deaminase [Acidobacteriota bacterium]
MAGTGPLSIADPADGIYMSRAIALATRALRSGQSPFGAVIVRGGEVLAGEHNRVIQDNDPTAHAEINAIRTATRAQQVIKLSGATIYSSCEPCPMCLAAIHWSGISRLVYAATIADARAAGFGEMTVSAIDLARLGGCAITLVRLDVPDARKPFELFLSRGGTTY